MQAFGELDVFVLAAHKPWFGFSSVKFLVKCHFCQWRKPSERSYWSSRSLLSNADAKISGISLTIWQLRANWTRWSTKTLIGRGRQRNATSIRTSSLYANQVPNCNSEKGWRAVLFQERPVEFGIIHEPIVFASQIFSNTRQDGMRSRKKFKQLIM